MMLAPHCLLRLRAPLLRSMSQRRDVPCVRERLIPAMSPSRPCVAQTHDTSLARGRAITRQPHQI
eukprot:6175935-Pleurochrysis_carterae.AAC.7